VSQTPDLRAMNQDMVSRLLAEPAKPYTESGYTLRVLQTRGRRTGNPRRTPIAVVQLRNRRYLVSPDRNRDWVRNLINDPHCTILTADETDSCLAVQVGAPEAAPVVSAYLLSMNVPWAIRAFPVPQDASLADITADLVTMAVFRLDHADGHN
jgi:deazaflavin-dependent oxidoreductase (nitroreductase family)